MRRCAQRNVPSEVMDFVRRNGQKSHKTGIVFFFLGKRDIPENLRGIDAYAKLEGMTLLESRDGQLITAYQNRYVYRKIRKKPKHRITNYGGQL